MAITINGKVYRNIQEQVAKNQEDIEDIKDAYATKGYVGNQINDVYGNVYTRDQADDRFPTEAHMEYVVGHVLQAEDSDYKTQLVFEPDDAYLKYYDKDPENPQDYSWGLVQKMFEIERLSDTHLYRHNIYMSVQLLNAGTLDTDYTAVIRFEIYNRDYQAYTTDNIVEKVNNCVSIPATGYAHHSVSENQYFVYGIKKNILDTTKLEIDLGTADYTPAGGIDAIIGNITYFLDRVTTII